MNQKDNVAELELFLTPANDTADPQNDLIEWQSDPTLGDLLYTVKTYPCGKTTGKWKLKAKKAEIYLEAIEDIGMICHYAVKE